MNFVTSNRFASTFKKGLLQGHFVFFMTAGEGLSAYTTLPCSSLKSQCNLWWCGLYRESQGQKSDDGHVFSTVLSIFSSFESMLLFDQHKIKAKTVTFWKREQSGKGTRVTRQVWGHLTQNKSSQVITHQTEWALIFCCTGWQRTDLSCQRWWWGHHLQEKKKKRHEPEKINMLVTEEKKGKNILI